MFAARSSLRRFFPLGLGIALFAIGVAGCGGAAPAAPTLGNAMIKSVEIATQSGSFTAPLDSTPDPSATTVYFTAGGPHGAGVFRVPVAGGAASEVAVGAPFVAPTGLAIDGAGQRLYVADSQADAGNGATGQLFGVATSDPRPMPIASTGGTAPRGLDVVQQDGAEVIYFTGKDPGDGQPAVFKLPAAGEARPTVVAKGAPLVEPDGVVVTKTGVVYVSDRAAAGNGVGSVFKIADATVTPVVAKVRTGNPAGIALTLDESILLVSALQPDRESDQVLMVDLSTLQTGSVTKVIEQNSKAGGVHRARNSNVFSWADLSAGSTGRVFIVR